MTNFRMAMIAAMTAAALAGSQALAADGALAPGKPAGVHQAARSPSLLLIGGAAVVAVVAVVVATQSSDYAPCGSACTVTSTSTTS
jgi:hypothetical protein